MKTEANIALAVWFKQTILPKRIDGEYTAPSDPIGGPCGCKDTGKGLRFRVKWVAGKPEITCITRIKGDGPCNKRVMLSQKDGSHVVVLCEVAAEAVA